MTSSGQLRSGNPKNVGTFHKLDQVNSSDDHDKGKVNRGKLQAGNLAHLINLMMTKEEMEQSMEKKMMMLRDDITKKRDKKMKNNKLGLSCAKLSSSLAS